MERREYLRNWLKTPKGLLYTQRKLKSARELRWALKGCIFDLLGKKCVHCGFNDERILQIDHVNGNGHQEKLESEIDGFYYYHRILVKILGGSKDYQLLCPNCNWIKRREKGEEN